MWDGTLFGPERVLVQFVQRRVVSECTRSFIVRKLPPGDHHYFFSFRAFLGLRADCVQFWGVFNWVGMHKLPSGPVPTKHRPHV